MKIINQLADWLLKTEHLSVERYRYVKEVILQENIPHEVQDMIEGRRKAVQRADEAAWGEECWWDLHGAGIRRSVGVRGRCSRRTPSDLTPIKVDALDAALPEWLQNRWRDFRLAALIRSVAAGSGFVVSDAGWPGFVSCVERLYGEDADVLHDGLRKALMRRPKVIGALLMDLKAGDTLFPADFLANLKGESVTVLRQRIQGGAPAFCSLKTDWILKYANLNLLNESCLVRNRIHRILRLWLAHAAELHENCRVTGGGACYHMRFGGRVIHLPVPGSGPSGRAITPKCLVLGSNASGIGNGAFANEQGLEEVKIGYQVERIGSCAFMDCESLRTVQIGWGMREISASAFEGCTSLISAPIGKCIFLRKIGFRAFAKCRSLCLMQIPAATTKIMALAFYDCLSLEHVVFEYESSPHTLEIGAFAFAHCAVDGLDFPARLKALGQFSFYSCSSLVRVNMALCRELEIGENAFAACSALVRVEMPYQCIVRGSAFEGCTSLEEVILDPSARISLIGDKAFTGCGNLKSALNLNGTRQIGAKAFCGCLALTAVRFGDVTESIGPGAFNGCSGLSDLVIPDGVTHIGEKAFYDCGNISKLSLGAGLKSIGAKAFARCTLKAPVVIPAGVEFIGSHAFADADILLPETVRGVAPDAFVGCRITLRTFTNAVEN